MAGKDRSDEDRPEFGPAATDPEDFAKKILNLVGKSIEEADSKAQIEASTNIGRFWLNTYEGYIKAGWPEEKATMLLTIQVMEFWKHVFGKSK